MSFQRMTISGSIRSSLKRPARAARATSSASSSIALIATISSAEPRSPLRRPRSSREPLRSPARAGRRARATVASAPRRRRGRAARPRSRSASGDLVDRERERDEVVAVVGRHEQAVGLRRAARRRPGRPRARAPSSRPASGRDGRGRGTAARRARFTASTASPASASSSKICPVPGPKPTVIRRSPSPAARQSGGDGGGRGDRQHPRDDDVPGDAPAHGREALRRSRPHHGARDDVRRRERIAVLRRRVDDGARRSPAPRSRLGGSIWKTRWPSVRMIRQPPA